MDFDEAVAGPGGAGFQWGAADAAEVVRYSIALPSRPAPGLEEEEPEEEAGSVAGGGLARVCCGCGVDCVCQLVAVIMMMMVGCAASAPA